MLVWNKWFANLHMFTSYVRFQPTWRFCRRWRLNMRLFPDGRRILQRPGNGMIFLQKLRTTSASLRIILVFLVSHSTLYKLHYNISLWIKTHVWFSSSQLSGLVLGNPENVWSRCSRCSGIMKIHQLKTISTVGLLFLLVGIHLSRKLIEDQLWMAEFMSWHYNDLSLRLIVDHHHTFTIFFISAVLSFWDSVDPVCQSGISLCCRIALYCFQCSHVRHIN